MRISQADANTDDCFEWQLYSCVKCHEVIAQDDLINCAACDKKLCPCHFGISGGEQICRGCEGVIDRDMAELDSAYSIHGESAAWLNRQNRS